MPSLSRITIFPIKSLDGVAVESATILPGGALEHDREFAMFDEQGGLINGKRTAQVHRVRSTFDLKLGTVSLQVPGVDRETTFHLLNEKSQLECWLSKFFGFSIEVRRIPLGHPDHNKTPGPSVISTASLLRVSQWFRQFDLDEARKRFRLNLEVSDVPAFWEDRLIGAPGTMRHFQIGDVELGGVSPCGRCVVPSRDPNSGEALPTFQKNFASMREADMPEWADRSAFAHFYHFGVLTIVAAGTVERVLRVGDEVIWQTAPMTEALEVTTDRSRTLIR